MGGREGGAGSRKRCGNCQGTSGCIVSRCRDCGRLRGPRQCRGESDGRHPPRD
ncbi:hypothetical protein ACFFX0_32210 [Citricoccus parietis]|uniref:Uncharacterized protein n=1 Tax=Citricoccus parietis TaxID=592307 RepID=A0ABV5G9J4_9MICC